MKSNIWNSDNNDNTYSNPILYTDYSDPDAIRVGDDYYMIASSFCNAPAIPVLHSKDLIHWNVINYVLDSIPEERYKDPIHGCGVWAPSIRYHEGTFFVCFPMPDEGIYMCTTKDPFSKWSEPVNIRPGAGWIDPCPFFDEDGKAYLVAGVAKSRIGYKSVLHMVEMRPDGMKLIGEEVKVFDGNLNDQHTIEGPKLYKRNGYYYIFAPAGGVKTGWQTVLRSKNIYGPYEYKVVMNQGNTSINGPHQGAWVDTENGEDYFIHFQDVYCAGRIIHLQPMTWENDWPIIGVKNGVTGIGEPVLTYRKPYVKDEYKNYYDEPDTSDDFCKDALSLQWQWNANYSEDFYELKDNALYLRPLYKKGPVSDAPNLLLQKWPAPEFACITELDLSNLNDNEEAGVISLGMEYGAVSFKRDGDSFIVSKIEGKQYFEGSLVSHTDERINEVTQIPSGNKKIYVKYLVQRIGYQDLNEEERNFPKEEVTISYSTNGNDYIDVLSMVAVPGRWVGVKNGVFCFGNSNEAASGSLKVCKVTYHRIYHNPVKRGFFPDPSITRVGNDYYMVNSTFQYFPAIAISHSTDLVNWELIGHAITNPKYLDIGNIKDSHGIWAPDIEYVDGKFVIMATLRLNGDKNVLRKQLVVTSDKPEGPYSEPVWIDVDNIDPSLFVDDDGKKYMLISPGINLVELSEDYHQISDVISVWPGTGERCPEGPHIFKHGEYYYGVLAEGGTGYGHGINVARSKNLFGPYEPSPYNPVLRQFDENAPLQRCGHGKFFEDADKNWWVVYLCGRPNEGKYTTIGRETGLEPVTWLEDGWFLVNGGNGPSETNIAPNLPSKIVIPWERDDFDSDCLDKRWQFVRLPSADYYSLTQRKGYLRLITQDGELSDISAKNIVLRREEELSYTAKTKLCFNPVLAGEHAGLTCYYSTATYIRCSVCFDGQRKMVLVINRNHGEELIAENVIDNDSPVYIKVEVKKLKRIFYYSFDDIKWIHLSTVDDCIFLCDEGVKDDPKRHTGTLVGMYACNGGNGNKNTADFDFFEMKNNRA